MLVVESDLTVSGASPAAERILGGPLRGRNLGEAVLDEDCDRLREELSGGEGAGALLLLRARPDADPSASEATRAAERRPTDIPALLVTLEPFRADEPTAGGALLVGRDATEELTREARVRRAARYEIVGQIASGVAHELNNLLSTVTTFSDLLLGDVDEGSTAAEDLADIKHAGLDASRVVRKLDLFACGLPAGPPEASAAEVVKGLEKLLRRFLPNEVTLETELEPGLPDVSAPAVRLEEIVLVLAANARDAMPDGGALHIAVRAGSGLADGRASVAVEVSDTGEGGAPPPIELATQPFFSTRPLGRGSGLGLGTAAGVVHDLGGTVGMERLASGGVRVRVELPAGGADAAREVAEEASVEDGPVPERVLVMEPRAGLRGVLMRSLARAGASVEGAAGLEEVERRDRGSATPTIVVADVPDRPGGAILTVESLRRLWPDVPVLLMRGRTAGEEPVGSRKAVGEVLKPFVLDHMHQTLARLLRDARAR
jgi:signal transduction histidine kinase